MPNTAPAPNIPAPPGMCPGACAAGGGGDGGGGSGKGAGKGKGKKKADTSKKKKNPKGGKKSAKKGKCGKASEPIDVVTGRVFTWDSIDVAVSGPLPFAFMRGYSSVANERDVGLGYGWAHSLGWEVVAYRSSVEVWDDEGTAIVFDAIGVGDDILGPEGWVLRREAWGYAVDSGDGFWRLFTQVDGNTQNPQRYRLTAIDNRNRSRITINYHDGCLSEVIDSVGRVFRFTATREGRIGAVSVKMGEVGAGWTELARYDYDERGNLVRAMDAEGYSSRYEYDEEHRLTTHVDRVGLAWHYVYDAKGRGIEAWGDYPGKVDPSLLEKGLPRHLADGVTRVKGVHHCKITYLPDNYSEVATPSNVIRYFGNEHGTVDKEVNGAGVESSTFDENGHRTSYTDENGSTTIWERDARGRITKATDPLGRVVEFRRDAMGLVTEYIDEAGASMKIDRDACGNPLLVVYANGGATSYRYNERGLPVEIVLPTGGRIAGFYDKHFNLVEVRLPNGGVYKWTYDYLGRRVSEVLPSGETNKYAWSNRNQVISVLSAEGLERIDYDGEERIVLQTDPSGHSVQTEYGGYNEVAEERDENGLTTSYRYDLEGQLLAIRNPSGDEWSFAYDGSGQCIHQKAFDGREYWFGYDPSGTITSLKDSLGRTTKLVYDQDLNLIERLLADGSEEKYEYDARGDLLSASNGVTTVRYRRDLMGQVIEESHEIDGEIFTVENSYDVWAERVSRKSSLGHDEIIERDGLGTAVRLRLGASPGSPLDVRFTRTYDGDELTRELGLGGRIESEIDHNGRVMSRRVMNIHSPSIADGMPEYVGKRRSGAIFERTFAYDIMGNVTRTTGRRGACEYSYDGGSRLLDALLSDGTKEASYRYDASSNRHDATGPKCVYGPGNRLLQRGNTYYTWDADGQLTEKRVIDPNHLVPDRVWKFEWNAKAQLDSVETADTRVEFRYDVFWRRVEKTVHRRGADQLWNLAERIRFVWDGDQLLHEIRTKVDASGEPIVEERTYCFDDDTDLPIAHCDRRRRGDTMESSPWFHYVNDQAGAPEALVLGDGQLVCELEKTANGHARPTPESTATTPLRLQGQYADEETGLSYNAFRYYDPEIGLFISSDPIGLDGGFNSYGYAPNPLGWADPMGLMATDIGNNAVGQALEDKRKRQLKRQKWEIIDTSCGRNGIDVMAVKRKNGKIVAMKIEECKANGGGVKKTDNGKQMSQKWIKKNIARKKRRSKKKGCTNDPKNVQDLKDAEAFMKDPKNKVEKAIITAQVDRTTGAVGPMSSAPVSTQGNKQVVGSATKISK